MNKSIYLCGPVTGGTFEDAKYGWRYDVANVLSRAGIICINPLRTEYVRDFSTDDLQTMKAMGTGAGVLSAPKGLTAQDRFDTFRCGIVFCNLIGSKSVSIGSMIELGWADARNTPILLCMEPGNVHDHAMVTTLASWVLPTLDDGIRLAADIFDTQFRSGKEI